MLRRISPIGSLQSPALAGFAIVGALGACTLDSTNATTGSGGAGTTSGAPTTTGSMTGATTSADTTTSSNTSSSASSVSASASSSSTGGPTNLPFCVPESDDFNGYMGDGGAMGFVVLGEGTGPWTEAPLGSGQVKWVGPGEIEIQHGGGKDGFLFPKAPTTIGAATCALTVRLVDVSSDLAVFGVSDGQTPVSFAALFCHENGGNCEPLETFNMAGENVSIGGGGVHLGIVFHDKHAFGLFDAGSGWQVIQGTPSGGTDLTALADVPLYPYFGQAGGDSTSHWDDFNVRPIPTSVSLP